MALMDLINDEAKLESINLEMRDQYIQTGYEVKEEEFVEREDSKAVIAAEVKARLLSKDEILQKAKDRFGAPEEVPRLTAPKEEPLRRSGLTEPDRGTSPTSRFGWSSSTDTDRYSSSSRGRVSYNLERDGDRRKLPVGMIASIKDYDPFTFAAEQVLLTITEDAKAKKNPDEVFLNRKRRNPKSLKAKIDVIAPKYTVRRKLLLVATGVAVGFTMGFIGRISGNCADEVIARRKQRSEL